MTIVATQGAVPPYALVLVITSDGVGVNNLTTVTAATIDFMHDDGSISSLSATLSAASATSLTLTHVYQTGDLPNLEVGWLVARLTVPSGTLFADSRALAVVGKFNQLVPL